MEEKSNSEVIQESQDNAIQGTRNHEYEKLKHLIEWLKNIQTKKDNQVPQEVIDIVNIEIALRKIKKEDLSANIICKILREIDFPEYYENQNEIINRVSNKN